MAIEFIEESEFMTDSTDRTKSKGSEAVMDYVMSWCLRNVTNNEKKIKYPKLYYQCKYMLCKLLGKENNLNNITFQAVKVWKEWENIDLFVEVELQENERFEKHIIIIENKVYSTMKPNQRDEYPKKVDAWKNQDEDWKNAKTHYRVITCCAPGDGGYKNLVEFCRNTDWKVFSSEEVVDWNVESYTELDLFNDFWFAHW